MKFTIALHGLILLLLFSVPASSSAQVVPPSRGGTGASTSPSYGQVLVGCQNYAGLWVYCPQATSSLNITAAGDGAFSTTSADYWQSLRNFFSTTSAAHWLTTKTTGDLAEGLNLYFTNARVQSYLDALAKGFFFSTSSADYWQTQRNFFSTTSANYWETQQTARSADDLTNNSIEDLLDVTTITENQGDLLYWNGSAWADIATSSLGLPTLSTLADYLTLPAWYATTTDGLDEGTANLYFTGARVQAYLDGIAKGFFFSTTSADYWKTQNNFFSTTSADYLATQRNFFSTTSADYWQSVRSFFSTTSANYWETQQTARTADDLTNNSIEDLSDVAAMTENFGDLLYWNGSAWTDLATSSLGLPSFAYPFPSNATSTALSFTNGIIASASSTFSYLTSGLVGNNNGRLYSFASSSLFGYTPVNPATTITLAGTANQISSSNSGAQALSGNVSTTLSLPNHVIFPANFQATNATTTNATTTALDITSRLTFAGTTGTTWSAFCTAITGGAGLCDGTDDGGAAASAFEIATTSSIAVPQLAYFTQASGRTTLGGVATTTLTITGPFNTSAVPVVLGSSPITSTYYGLATTTALTSSQLLVSNGAAGVYGVSTSSATINNGLTGTLTTLGSGQSVGLATIAANSILANQTSGVAVPSALATSTLANGLYVGTAGQVLYRTSAGTWVGTATTTAGTGLTYNGTSFNVNTSQNIATLSNLTTDGVVYTSGANGTLNVDAGALDYARGGTGSTTAPISQLIYGGSSAYQSVATSSATCTSASGVSCTGFTIVGAGGTTIALSSIPNSSLANSSISGISLGSNLADLTAGNSSLTFSGTYNGGTARNVVLNVSNANTWSALQTFANASSSLLSSNGPLWVGTTSTTTIWGNATSTFRGGLNVATGGLRVSTLTSCNTVDTDSSGNFICGTDEGGAGGGSPGGSGSELQYRVDASTFGPVANSAYLLNGRVGFGSTSPWGLVSVSSSTISDYSKPLLAISTSSDPWGQLLAVFATTSTLYDSGVSSAVSGVRLVVGRFVGAVTNVFFNGSVSSSWDNLYCDSFKLLQTISADTVGVCGWMSFDETSNSSLARQVASSQDGTDRVLLSSTAGTGADTAVLGLGQEYGLGLSSTTPVMEVVLGQTLGLSTSSQAYIGWVNSITTPTFGCYITASSTTGSTYAAVCRTSATSVTQVNTGIATSTANTSPIKVRLELDSTSFRVFTKSSPQSVYGSAPVASISTNLPNTGTAMNATIALNRAAGGTATQPQLNIFAVRLYRQSPWWWRDI